MARPMGRGQAASAPCAGGRLARCGTPREGWAGLSGSGGWNKPRTARLTFAALWRGVRYDRSVSASRPWARWLECGGRMADRISPAFPRQRDKAGWNRIEKELRLRQVSGCLYFGAACAVSRERLKIISYSRSGGSALHRPGRGGRAGRFADCP